jgi:hypothetical protein
LTSFFLFLFVSFSSSANQCNDLFIKCDNCHSHHDHRRNISGATLSSLSVVPESTLRLQKALLKVGWETNSGNARFVSELEQALQKAQKKMKQDAFIDYMQLWDQWNRLVAEYIEKMDRLPPHEKKIWQKKFSPIVHFSQKHFLTFLLTQRSDFKYERLFSTIKSGLQSEEKVDPVFFIYQFEKNIRKFSSEREFRNCRT